MAHTRTAQALAAVAAVAYVVAAGLHFTSYRQVVLQAQQGISGLAPLVATLWLTFGVAMLVLGGIAALVALGRVGGGRWLLASAGCFPLITVVLQLRLLGFTRPTGVFAAVAALSFVAAAAHRNGE